MQFASQYLYEWNFTLWGGIHTNVPFPFCTQNDLVKESFQWQWQFSMLFEIEWQRSKTETTIKNITILIGSNVKFFQYIFYCAVLRYACCVSYIIP